MEITKSKIDSKVVEAGEWVDKIPEMDDLRLRVRGINNADYLNLQRKLIQAIPFKRRRRGVSQADMEAVTNQCLLETVLCDWEHFTEGGKDLPYSMDVAKKYICDPDYRAFRDAVTWAATVVGTDKDEEDGETEKNSA